MVTRLTNIRRQLHFYACDAVDGFLYLHHARHPNTTISTTRFIISCDASAKLAPCWLNLIIRLIPAVDGISFASQTSHSGVAVAGHDKLDRKKQGRVMTRISW